MMTFNRPPFRFAVATLAVVGIACSSNAPGGSSGQGTGGASGGALATGTGGKAGAAGTTSGTGGRGSGGGTAGGAGGLASGGSGASSSAFGGHGSGGGGFGSGGSGGRRLGGSVTGGSAAARPAAGGSVTGGSGGSATRRQRDRRLGRQRDRWPGAARPAARAAARAGGSGGSTTGALVQAYDGAARQELQRRLEILPRRRLGRPAADLRRHLWRSLSVPHDWSVELRSTRIRRRATAADFWTGASAGTERHSPGLRPIPASRSGSSSTACT